MTRDNDNHPDNDDALLHGFDTGPSGKNQRQEPTFSRFEDDEAYEEPDRDSDYTSGYHEEEVEQEEDFDDDFSDDDDSDLFQEEDTYDTDLDGEDDEDELDTWRGKGSYFEEDEDRSQSWPLSLIAVAVAALVLLAAGVYGVMQQRAATEDELRELRAALATTANPRSTNPSRDSGAELQLAYDKLASEAQTLRLENRTLTDIVAGLEAQLGDQQSMPAIRGSAVKPATPATNTVAQATPQPARPTAAQPVVSEPPVSRPAAAKSAAAATSGPWFVNFGSYAMRSVADSWAARLKPSAGKVIIMPMTSDGKTLYRLRVIGLPDRETAKQVARKLESDLRVAELWVGKE